MGRAKVLQEIRTMRFEEVYVRWSERRLTQSEAAELLNVCERQFRRQCRRYEDEGIEGLIDLRLGQVSSKRAPVDEVLRLVEQYRPRWMEESTHPEKIEAFAALRRSTTVPIASGEHFYGRWEVERYLQAGALSVVQADPEWCGGISELVKIGTRPIGRPGGPDRIGSNHGASAAAKGTHRRVSDREAVGNAQPGREGRAEADGGASVHTHRDSQRAF